MIDEHGESMIENGAQYGGEHKRTWERRQRKKRMLLLLPPSIIAKSDRSLKGLAASIFAENASAYAKNRTGASP